MESTKNNEGNESLGHDIGQVIGLLGSLMITNAVMDNHNKNELEKMQKHIDDVEQAEKNVDDYMKSKWGN